MLLQMHDAIIVTLNKHPVLTNLHFGFKETFYALRSIAGLYINFIKGLDIKHLEC